VRVICRHACLYLLLAAAIAAAVWAGLALGGMP
jgi:hypothetical protein